MSDDLIEQVKRLAEAQKNCWASKWPLERVNDTSLGAYTCHMVQVGVTDDGEPIGDVDGGLEPVAEGHKDVLDLLVASLGFDFPALLAHMQAQQAVVDAARELRDGMNVGASDGNSHRHLSVQQWRWDALKDALTALENLRSDNDGK